MSILFRTFGDQGDSFRENRPPGPPAKAFLCDPLCHCLSTSCFFDKDFCDGSPGAPISAPKDGPKGLLRLRVPPALWLKLGGRFEVLFITKQMDIINSEIYKEQL